VLKLFAPLLNVGRVGVTLPRFAAGMPRNARGIGTTGEDRVRRWRQRLSWRERREGRAGERTPTRASAPCRETRPTVSSVTVNNPLLTTVAGS
jgi:hypothetical protein